MTTERCAALCCRAARAPPVGWSGGGQWRTPHESLHYVSACVQTLARWWVGEQAVSEALPGQPPPLPALPACLPACLPREQRAGSAGGRLCCLPACAPMSAPLSVCPPVRWVGGRLVKCKGSVRSYVFINLNLVLLVLVIRLDLFGIDALF